MERKCRDGDGGQHSDAEGEFDEQSGGPALGGEEADFQGGGDVGAAGVFGDEGPREMRRPAIR